jgi:5-methylthioribose kinase
MRLGTETVGAYLRDSGVAPLDAELSVEPLGGGVSNGVFRVSWPGDEVVVKQPLPDLDVDDDWPADVTRVHNEAAATRVYRDALEHERVEHVVVPEVRFEDHDEHVVVLSAAPRTARTWKSDLLDGSVEPAVAATLGEFLALVRSFSADRASIRDEFENYTPFEQLRLDPYHETVARRHPDVAAEIEAEVDRVRNTRTALVHGDYSPKNVLVNDATSPTSLWMLDFEVAHWGDPTFDVAFMLNHLLVKSVYNHERSDEYVSAAATFWERYTTTADTDRSFEAGVVSELGVLMLARVDGKSPVEYVQRESTKDQLRALARRLLSAEPPTIERAIQLRSEVNVT